MNLKINNMSIENKIIKHYKGVLLGYRLAKRYNRNYIKIGYKLDSIGAVNNEEGD